MKKVLLTNFIVREYTGSEIDTVTIANHFLEIGYKVDIFTLNFGYPLKGRLNKKIRIFDNADKLDKHYDLIWAHHFPLLDYLLFNKEIEAEYIHYIALSSFEPYECLPFYYEKLSKVSTVSQEIIKKLKKEGYKTRKIDIFTNYATQFFFDNAKKNHSTKLNKICIVSNHVPKELYDFKKIANDSGIIVDIFGKNDHFVEITPQILKKYDVVISIGKTVNYALALKIPCYCYDHFGGYGFIKKNNIEISYSFNFSGRGFGIKKDGMQIFDDIKQNFLSTIQDAQYLQNYAYTHFSLENRMAKILQGINKKKKINYKALRKKYFYLKRTSRLFIRETVKQYNLGNNVQIFQSNDENFTEEQSSKFYYNSNQEVIKFDYEICKDTKFIRIDFSNQSLICFDKLLINNKPVSINKFANVYEYNGKLISNNDDPQLYLKYNSLNQNRLVNFELHLKKLNLEEFQKMKG